MRFICIRALRYGTNITPQSARGTKKTPNWAVCPLGGLPRLTVLKCGCGARYRDNEIKSSLCDAENEDFRDNEEFSSL